MENIVQEGIKLIDLLQLQKYKADEIVLKTNSTKQNHFSSRDNFFFWAMKEFALFSRQDLVNSV